jgi:hypothetical protein
MPGVGIFDSLELLSRENVGMPQEAAKTRAMLLTPTTQLARLKSMAKSIEESLCEISL